MPGIGQKTAAVLISHFGSLDALLARIDEVPFLRQRGSARAAASLRAHREQVLMYRQLTTIAVDAPLQPHEAPFARGDADVATLSSLCDSLHFGPMTRRRLHALADTTSPH